MTYMSYMMTLSRDASQWPIGNFRIGPRPCSDNSTQILKGYHKYDSPKTTDCEQDMEYNPMLNDSVISEWSILEDNNLSDTVFNIFNLTKNATENITASIEAKKNHEFNLWTKPNKNWAG